MPVAQENPGPVVRSLRNPLPQPGMGECPVVVGGPLRDIQRGGRLFNGQPTHSLTYANGMSRWVAPSSPRVESIKV